MKRVSPNRQGDLDGLCGIYALTNFLRDLRFNNRYISVGKTPERRSDDAFWLLLDTAYRLRMLTPDYIIHGYAAHHLALVWNTLSREADFQYQAVLISKLKRLGKVSTFDAIKCIFDEPVANAVLIRWDDHWFLSDSLRSQDAIAAIDSAPNGRRRSLSRSIINRGGVDGLALLATGSKILECARKELDA